MPPYNAIAMSDVVEFMTVVTESLALYSDCNIVKERHDVKPSSITRIRSKQAVVWWLRLNMNHAMIFYFSSIQIHTSTENRTSNHKWVTALHWSTEGRQWAGPVALHSDISTTGDVIQTAYTTSTQLGQKIRLAVGVGNTSGAAIETGVASAWAVFTFKS